MNLRGEIRCEVGWRKGVSILVVDGGSLVGTIVMGIKTGHFTGAVLWLKRLFSSFSPRRPVLNLGASPCGFFWWAKRQWDRFDVLCGPCNVIYLRNKDQQDALFSLNLFP